MSNTLEQPVPTDGVDNDPNQIQVLVVSQISQNLLKTLALVDMAGQVHNDPLIFCQHRLTVIFIGFEFIDVNFFI